MPTNTASSRTASEPAEFALEALAAALRDLLPAEPELDSALERAIADAQVIAAGAEPADCPRLVTDVLLGELLIAAATRSVAIPVDITADAARLARLDRHQLEFDVGARTLGDVRLSELPPAAAVEAVLSLVHVLTPSTHVSLWRRVSAGRVECLACVGDGVPSRSVYDAARVSLANPAGCSRRGLLEVVTLPERGDSVLIARPRARGREQVRAFLRLASRSLACALGRAAALEREQPVGETLAAASERRLARIGFDLHDGPIQSLAALIAESRLFGSQLGDLLDGDERQEVVAGRVADLQALIIGLEFELRCMCRSLEAPAVLRSPFERVIEHEVVTFQLRTGVEPRVELTGTFDTLTASQRIALLRVIQEALRNVREHSDAANVSVEVHARPNATEAVVRNDGPGFDVEAALARAVKDGRVGLVGMIERIRLLGGRCKVESAVGGPTTVSIHLPRWQPEAAAA
jgi:signal transduction histidine kinase